MSGDCLGMEQNDMDSAKEVVDKCHVRVAPITHFQIYIVITESKLILMDAWKKGSFVPKTIPDGSTLARGQSLIRWQHCTMT